MRSIKTASFVAFIAIALIISTAFKMKLLNKADSNPGFAVVELFTSEGCSSCPPADAVVAKIQKESMGKPVYILAYHVDYWNSLGWKDVFSNAGYSKRQNEYAHYLHLQSVYTPQVIVNGKTEFVGSEEGTLRSNIKSSLQKTPEVSLTLNVTNISEKQANIKYDIDGTDKKAVLLIAVLQKNAQTKVERGENSGHTLSHVQIVRQLQRVTLDGNAGTAKVDLPQGFDKQNWDIIGFLQNTADGSITGATRLSF